MDLVQIHIGCLPQLLITNIIIKIYILLLLNSITSYFRNQFVQCFLFILSVAPTHLNNVNFNIVKKFQHPILDIKSFYSPDAYDLIISNPPFYQKSLKSPDSQINKALHAVELTFEELIDSVKRLLKPDGRFAVLLPPFEVEKLIDIAQKKELYLSKKILIRHDESKPIFRIIATFQNLTMSDYQEETLVIHEKNSKTYSENFRTLLKDYYLAP